LLLHLDTFCLTVAFS